MADEGFDFDAIPREAWVELFEKAQAMKESLSDWQPWGHYEVPQEAMIELLNAVWRIKNPQADYSTYHWRLLTEPELRAEFEAQGGRV